MKILITASSLILVGCSSHQPSGASADSSVVPFSKWAIEVMQGGPSNALLIPTKVEAEIVELAKKEAALKGVDLSQYDGPRIEIVRRSDKVVLYLDSECDGIIWGLGYSRKGPPYPDGGFFWMYVDDESGEVRWEYGL